MSFRILIIDDDADVVETMKTVLKSSNYTIESAYNSKEGLEKVISFDPQLILLDVMISTPTDGFSLSYTLRSGENEYRKWLKTPIVMISSINQELKMNYSTKTDSEFMAVDEFIEKPINPEKLLELAKKYSNAQAR